MRFTVNSQYLSQPGPFQGHDRRRNEADLPMVSASARSTKGPAAAAVLLTNGAPKIT